MEREAKFFVQRIGERWTFGRRGTAFEVFSSEELALARATEFARQNPDKEVVLVDAKGVERDVRALAAPKPRR